MSDDPFSPIDPKKKGAHLRSVASNDFALIAPVPRDAPAPPATHPKEGAPSARYEYRNADGELLGFICRFETPDGKTFRPLAYWRPTQGSAAPQWRWLSWTEPRPLYGLDRLAARAAAPVVVCEGEKAADAAARLLLDCCVCVTSPNGSKSAAKADWSALKGRAVVVWPDADEPGAEYAAQVTRLACAAGAASVAIVDLPAGLAEGFDAADAEREGWTPERAATLIDSANASPGVAAAAPARGRRRKANADDDAAPRKRGAEAVLDIVEDGECEFWHNEDRTAFVTFNVKGHAENHPIASREFEEFIYLRCDRTGVRPPAKSAFDDALRTLRARALAGPRKRTWRRVGEADDGSWLIDLGDDAWRCVKISGGRWAILDAHRFPMIRSPAFEALPTPEILVGDGLAKLRPFVNADEDGFRLVVAWLLSAHRPDGPYPILVLNGEQGSAKSTLSRHLRELVDPNMAALRTIPKDEADLFVSTRNSHVLIFDNVSAISNEMSDSLCRIATGGAYATRVKYSDGDEYLIKAKNPIVLNGIPSLANRADLASRAVFVRLEPIPDAARKSERAHNAEWRAAAPFIFGALLDILAAAHKNLPRVDLAAASRMADFEALIAAAEPALYEALGWEPGSFAEIYRLNRAEQDEQTIEADLVASTIIAFIRENEHYGWEGEPATLYDLLSARIGDPQKRSRLWPNCPASLTNRIERAKPLLRRHGLEISRHKSGSRKILIAPKANFV